MATYEVGSSSQYKTITELMSSVTLNNGDVIALTSNIDDSGITISKNVTIKSADDQHTYKITAVKSEQSIITIGNGADETALNVTISNVILTDAHFDSNDGDSDVGGAVSINDSNVTLNISGVTFTDNSAQRGGAIGVTDASDNYRLNVVNSLFQANYVNGYDGETKTNCGAAIGAYNASGAIMVSGSTFTKNHADGHADAEGGGAIYQGGDATLTITNSEFYENWSDWGGDGGAVYSRGVSVSISGSTFSGNYTGTSSGAGSGGAVYYCKDGDGSFSVTNSVFDANTASNAGGAVQVENFDGTAVVSGSTFTDNFSRNNSGALGFSQGSASATVSDSAFDGNSSNGAGGALGFLNASGKSTVSNSVFNENSTPSTQRNGDGGAIIIRDSTGDVTIEDSLFTDNLANGEGGSAIAIENASGTVSIVNDTFDGNTSNSSNNSGGTIYEFTSKWVNLINCTIVNSNGNGVWFWDDLNGTIANTIIAGSSTGTDFRHQNGKNANIKFVSVLYGSYFNDNGNFSETNSISGVTVETAFGTADLTIVDGLLNPTQYVDGKGSLIGAVDGVLYYVDSNGAWVSVSDGSTAGTFDAQGENYGLTIAGSSSTTIYDKDASGESYVVGDDGSIAAGAAVYSYATATTAAGGKDRLTKSSDLAAVEAGSTVTFVGGTATLDGLTIASDIVIAGTMTIDGTIAIDSSFSLDAATALTVDAAFGGEPVTITIDASGYVGSAHYLISGSGFDSASNVVYSVLENGAVSEKWKAVANEYGLYLTRTTYVDLYVDSDWTEDNLPSSFASIMLEWNKNAFASIPAISYDIETVFLVGGSVGGGNMNGADVVVAGTTSGLSYGTIQTTGLTNVGDLTIQAGASLAGSVAMSGVLTVDLSGRTLSSGLSTNYEEIFADISGASSFAFTAGTGFAGVYANGSVYLLEKGGDVFVNSGYSSAIDGTIIGDSMLFYGLNAFDANQFDAAKKSVQGVEGATVFITGGNFSGINIGLTPEDANHISISGATFSGDNFHGLGCINTNGTISGERSLVMENVYVDGGVARLLGSGSNWQDNNLEKLNAVSSVLVSDSTFTGSLWTSKWTNINAEFSLTLNNTRIDGDFWALGDSRAQAGADAVYDIRVIGSSVGGQLYGFFGYDNQSGTLNLTISDSSIQAITGAYSGGAPNADLVIDASSSTILSIVGVATQMGGSATFRLSDVLIRKNVTGKTAFSQTEGFVYEISGSTIAGTFVGGASVGTSASTSDSAKIEGDLSIEAVGSTFENDVYGGGWDANSSSSGTSARTAISNNLVFDATDSRFLSSIYVAGYAENSTPVVEGDATVTLTSSYVAGGLYAGKSSALVAGTYTAALNGSTIAGNVYGFTDTRNEASNERILRVFGSTSEIQGELMGFTNVVVEDGGTLVLKNSMYGDSFTVESGGRLAFAADETSLEFNTITIEAGGELLLSGSKECYLIDGGSFQNLGTIVIDCAGLSAGDEMFLVWNDAGMEIDYGNISYVNTDSNLVYVALKDEDYGDLILTVSERTDFFYDGVAATISSISVGSSYYGGSDCSSSGISCTEAVLSFSGAQGDSSVKAYGGSRVQNQANAAESFESGIVVANSSLGQIYGGSLVSGAGASLNQPASGKISVSIESGSVLFVVGGSRVENSASLVSATDTATTISGGTASTLVIGGNMLNDKAGANSALIDSGVHTTTISGGVIDGIVVGGNYIQASSALGQEQLTQTGSSEVIVTGGTFKGSIYGATSYSSSSASKGTTLAGNVSIMIDSSSNKIEFADASADASGLTGSIFAGGHGYSQIDGDATVTFKGLGSNLTFNGYLSGASSYLKRSQIDSAVTGTATLAFESFTGELNADTIMMFKELSIDSNSYVVLTGENIDFSTIATWNLSQYAADASVTTLDWTPDSGQTQTNFTWNDFSGDTLNLTMSDGADSWTVIEFTTYEHQMNGIESAASVNLNGESAAWNGSAWVSASYSLAVAESSNSLVMSRGTLA